MAKKYLENDVFFVVFYLCGIVTLRKIYPAIYKFMEFMDLPIKGKAQYEGEGCGLLLDRCTNSQSQHFNHNDNVNL